MNLLSFAERLAASGHAAVTLNAERCLRAHDLAATCRTCFEICPAKAISAGSPPALDAQACQGCLACLPACPTGAFGGEDAAPELLSSAARVEGTQLELVCALHPQPELGASQQAAAVKVRGCLAGLGAGTGMALAALGFERVTYRCDACAECPWEALQGQIRLQVAEAQQLLAPWKKSGVPVVCERLENPVGRPLWKAANQAVSRRDLFRLAVQPAKVSAARAIDNGEALQPHTPGRDRARKLKAAAALGEPLERAALPAQGHFAYFTASPECDACGACARACPTQAMVLWMDEGKQSYRLVDYPQKCIDCGLCVRACAPGALQAGGPPPFEAVFRTENAILLQEGELARCERCNSLFPARTGAHLCSLCQYRQANPFGSKLPPGFKLPFAKKKNPVL